MQDARGDAGAGAPAVAFEAELGFEGLVDGFDDLAQRPQEPLGGSWWFCFGGGADEGDARGCELFFERDVETSDPAWEFPGKTW